jgi:eukaryotic-like serine/threonine-protein kinase
MVELVGAALERSPDDREAFVREHCADDAELVDEALAVLAQEGRSMAAGLTASVESRVCSAASRVSADADRLAQVGPYRILEVLGEGGMGTVYRAEQREPLQREVALKVIRRGLVGAGAAARFNAESRALAVMNHPHIARIFDVGSTASGQAYFAMELVPGRPITRYCDEERLRLPARLELFRLVCLAVQHAHQCGIIHRDLKPSNVLVTEIDGVATPKIIDFGIAKATEDGLDIAAARTEAGMLLGTLEYMSPEQAVADPGRIDTRSDIYSLGVMLYELVSGRLPFEPGALRGAAALEAQRILQDVDPPRPSQRLGAGAPDAETTAAARATDRRLLHRQVRGDLDWVIMKTLEKDPARRYQSAYDLAAEIERIQRDQPVSAGPPSRRYRAVKFARRHRVGVIAGAAVLLAIVAGSGLAVTGFVQATREQRRAASEAATTRVINEFLTDMLVSVQPDKARGKEVTVREILDAAAARLGEDARFTEAPEVEASLSYTIGDTYMLLGEYDLALQFLEHSLAIRRRLLDETDDRVVDTIDRIGQVHWRQGDLAGSLQCCQEILAIRERTVGRLHPQYSAVLGNIGNTYADMGRLDEAEAYLREALAIDRQVLSDKDGADLAITLNNLGSLLADQEKFAEAIALHRESLALRRRFHGEPSPAVLVSLNNLGFAQTGLGEYEAAEHTLRDAVHDSELIYGDEHPQTAIAWANLSSPLRKLGRYEESERLVRRALAVVDRSIGERSWRAGSLRGSLGAVLLDEGRGEEAERELLLSWRILGETLGEDRKAACNTARSLAALYAGRGDTTLAAAWEGRAARGRG